MASPSMVQPGIHLVVMPSQYMLAATFMRFQEYYESPRFKDADFTVEEFMDWYAETHDGEFTYFDDWHGFNVPSHVFEHFGYQTHSNCWWHRLLEKETRLLQKVANLPKPYYIIGLTEKTVQKGVNLKHEFVHGLFYTDSGFREKVLAIICSYERLSIYKILRKWGYHSDVWEDEIVAYFLTGLTEELSPLRKQYRDMSLELTKAFMTHYGFSISRASAQEMLNRVNIIRW